MPTEEDHKKIAFKYKKALKKRVDARVNYLENKLDRLKRGNAPREGVYKDLTEELANLKKFEEQMEEEAMCLAKELAKYEKIIENKNLREQYAHNYFITRTSDYDRPLSPKKAREKVIEFAKRAYKKFS